MSQIEPRRLGLDEAWNIARALVEELRPASHRIQVAGSCRRECAMVGDLEIVAIPRDETREGGLFGVVENAIWRRLEDLGRDRVLPLKPSSAELVADPAWAEKSRPGSKYFRLFLPRPRVKVDLFLAEPETWGSVLTIRTGSATFSHELVKHWTRVSGGGHFDKGRVISPRGHAYDTPEEIDVFNLLGIAWVDPKRRLSGAQIQPVVRAARRFA